MKLRWKKQIVNTYTLMAMILVPVLAFVMFGIITGLFPKFWAQMRSGESAAGENLYVFAHLRYAVCMVDEIEWFFTDIQNLLPLLASIVIIPFIQMRDCFLPYAQSRLNNRNYMEQKMIIQSVILSGIIIFMGYLLTMLWSWLMFVETYRDGCTFDVFVNYLEWPIVAEQHPYTYMLLLGVLRCFLLPMLMALLTIAVSYLTNKIYISLLVPTVYFILGGKFFAQSISGDKWPLPLFSPSNLIWPTARDEWGYGHDVQGIWGVVGASLIIIIPSVLMIWYGMRKRRI